MRAGRVVLGAVGAAVGMFLVAGCGAGVPQGGHGGRAPLVDRPIVVLNEVVNHTTVHVPTGAEVVLVLGSGYWQVKGSSAPAVLRQLGPTHAMARPSSCRSLPGLGCTPQETEFSAKARGTAVIWAGRTNCGEVMRCSIKQENFTVTLVVD